MVDGEADIARKPVVLPPARPITLVDQIVSTIVRGAAEGRFRPGQIVIEAELARELDVSRVPVREALRLLESQGIVVNEPYRGKRFMDVNRSELRDALTVRAELEKLAIRLARSKFGRNRDGFDAAKRHLADLEKASGAYEIALADAAFHRAVCEFAGNKVLLQHWDMLMRRLTIFIGLASCMMKDGDLITEHCDLLEAIKHEPAPSLSRIVDAHILEVLLYVKYGSDDAPQTVIGR